MISALLVGKRAAGAVRSLMSRAIFEAPITVPVSSRIGETVSEIGTSEPSLRWRWVSKWSTAFAAADPGEHLVLLALPVGRNDDPDRPPDRLVGGVAEHPLGGAIPRADDAVEVLADDRVVGRFDDLGEIATAEGIGIGRHGGLNVPDAGVVTRSLTNLIGATIGPVSLANRHVAWTIAGNPARLDGSSHPVVCTPSIAAAKRRDCAAVAHAEPGSPRLPLVRRPIKAQAIHTPQAADVDKTGVAPQLPSWHLPSALGNASCTHARARRQR